MSTEHAELLDYAEQGSTPAPPASGFWRLYAKADGFYVQDAAGTEIGPLAVGGGGGSAGFYLDSAALDGTMGDDFDGASLNARWTRHNISSGWEVYGAANSALAVDIGSATVDQLYTQACPAGDWEFILSAAMHGQGARMFGLFVIDAAGTGRGVGAYSADYVYGATLTTYGYAGSFGQTGDFSGYVAANGARIWFRLRKVSTTISASFSLDGQMWSREVSVTDSTTWDRVAIGRVIGTDTNTRMVFHRFNKSP